MKKQNQTKQFIYKLGATLLSSFIMFTFVMHSVIECMRKQYWLCGFYFLLGLLFFYITYRVYCHVAKPKLKKLSLLHKKIFFQICFLSLLIAILMTLYNLNAPIPPFHLFSIMLCVGVAMYSLLTQTALRYMVSKDQDPIVREESRRKTLNPFYLTTNQIEYDLENHLITLKGFIHGKIKKGEMCYLYVSKDSFQMGEIIGIFSNQEFFSVMENQVGEVKIQCMHIPQDIPFLYVCTNVQDVAFENIDCPVENPFLTGLFCASNDLRETNGFYHILFKEIAHANYLVSTANTTQDNKNLLQIIKSVFEDDSVFSFRSLTTKDTLAEYFPVYTGTFPYDLSPDAKEQTTVLIFGFKELTHLIEDRKGSIVFNPFGPGVFFLPHTFIEELISSNGYRNDFQAWPGDTTQEKIHLFLNEFFENPKTLADMLELFQLELSSIPNTGMDECYCVIEQIDENRLQFQFVRLFMDSDEKIKTAMIEVDVESEKTIKEAIHIPLTIKRKPFQKLYKHPLYQELKEQPILLRRSYCEDKSLNV